MAARITEAERYARGDRRLRHIIDTLAVAVPVAFGTAASLAVTGTWPGLGIGWRVLAGAGVFLSFAWLLIVRGDR
ncbi:hypothetical protein [Amycolatopsis taiwanensis]|uniref:hypothetical protein n=1 Tax=Amycolatopsis taiwanensis TaxID=342230 RepID=UPI0004861BE6|nr:hypothetical protein [Amycolatopsis taiwanensis]